jgi:DNA-binding transcriptional LysR family regulator
MASLDDYSAFVAIIDHGSLTAAARHVGRSLQAVSRSLAALERELGSELVIRTTRRLRATDAGLAFHARVKAALADLDLARDALLYDSRALAGRLRIGASTQFGPTYLVPVLMAFMERHPNVEIDLALADRHVDLLAEGLDLALRIGDLPDSNLMARRLGSVHRIVLGAPGYFAAHGRPEHPSDLAEHSCILRRGSGPTEVWSFGEGASRQDVEVRGRFRSDSPQARNEAAAAGFGIAIAPLYQVRHLLDAGRIETVLSAHATPPTPVHIVWPPGSAMPLRTRTLVDFIAKRLSLTGL